MATKKRKTKKERITFWSRNCTGCSRARRFFATYPHLVFEAIDVRSTPVLEDEALEIVRAARRLLTKDGTKVVEFDMARDKPDDEVLKRLVLGRSGTMRAPALRVDEAVMIGFDEDIYMELLDLPH